MDKGKTSIKVISCAFAVLYGSIYLSLLASPDIFGPELIPGHAALLKILCLLLTLTGLWLLLYVDLARKAFLVENALLSSYLFIYMLVSRDIQLLAFILTNIVAVLFFVEDKTVGEFRRKKEIVRKSVLIVDDDEVGLRAVQGILLSNGYSVLTAASGEKGLQVANLQQPDLIILDVILPGIKGREVCARLKEDTETRHIPVVFLTAKDSLDDIHAEMAAGAVSHITKPVHAKTLLAEVRRILDQYQGA